MSDMMTFPDTVDEFMDSYKVIDTEGIYMSKGSELVPIFRMKQWFGHLPEPKTGEWIDTDNYYRRWKCSVCGSHTRESLGDFCPFCGSRNRRKEVENEN